MTLTLPERIRWLHSSEGPKGKLSHDKFGKELGGVSRQTIIGWEKEAGAEPDEENAQALAEFSGFKPEAFSRRLAEAPAAATIRSRLEELAELVARGFLVLGVTPEQLRPHEEGRSRGEASSQ